MDYNQLFEQIKAKKSFLCVGLDSDIAKIPPHLLQLEDPVFEFNKAVIDATAEVAIAYKPNIAFYESRGVEGWKSLEKTNTISGRVTRIFLLLRMLSGGISEILRRCMPKLFWKLLLSIRSRWLPIWEKIR